MLAKPACFLGAQSLLTMWEAHPLLASLLRMQPESLDAWHRLLREEPATQDVLQVEICIRPLIPPAQPRAAT